MGRAARRRGAGEKDGEGEMVTVIAIAIIIIIGEKERVGEEEMVLSGGRDEKRSRRWIDSAKW